MGINQALSAALSGIGITQQAISVIAGNVANANTAGYVEESVNQSELGTAGTPEPASKVDGINRNLNALLQNQLWTETSGGSYADTVAQLYQQLQRRLRHAGIVVIVRRDLQQFHHRAAIPVDEPERLFQSDCRHQARRRRSRKISIR